MAEYLDLINQDSDGPLVDTQGIPTGDAWDIMHLVKSPWTLSSGDRAAMGAIRMTDSPLQLRGGIIDITNSRLDGKSILNGEGQIGQTRCGQKWPFWTIRCCAPVERESIGLVIPN
jgi:hypothetical protein